MGRTKELIVEEPCKPAQIEVCQRIQPLAVLDLVKDLHTYLELYHLIILGDLVVSYLMESIGGVSC